MAIVAEPTATSVETVKDDTPVIFVPDSVTPPMTPTFVISVSAPVNFLTPVKEPAVTVKVPSVSVFEDRVFNPVNVAVKAVDVKFALPDTKDVVSTFVTPDNVEFCKLMLPMLPVVTVTDEEVNPTTSVKLPLVKVATPSVNVAMFATVDTVRSLIVDVPFTIKLVDIVPLVDVMLFVPVMFPPDKVVVPSFICVADKEPVVDKLLECMFKSPDVMVVTDKLLTPVIVLFVRVATSEPVPT